MSFVFWSKDGADSFYHESLAHERNICNKKLEQSTNIIQNAIISPSVTVSFPVAGVVQVIKCTIARANCDYFCGLSHMGEM